MTAGYCSLKLSLHELQRVAALAAFRRGSGGQSEAVGTAGTKRSHESLRNCVLLNTIVHSEDAREDLISGGFTMLRRSIRRRIWNHCGQLFDWE